MRVAEAKDLVLRLMEQDIRTGGLAVARDARVSDRRDPGKSMLANMPARVIHRFDYSSRSVPGLSD